MSIRAAGRGLNLQTSDTVVIYDPDPNPKNEEQAIARSHRIGQKKEVRVFHMEAVTDPVGGVAAAAAPKLQPDGAAHPQPPGSSTDAGVNGVPTINHGGIIADAVELPPYNPAIPGSVKPYGLGADVNGDGNLYGDSIESLVRNMIQKHKNEMANEVIDAGRFDMETTSDERRKTLETLLQVGCLQACRMSWCMMMLHEVLVAIWHHRSSR